MSTYGPIGTRSNDSGVNVIAFTRGYPVAPERMWRALTTEDGLSSWLAPRVVIDPRLGGEVTVTFDEDNIVTGVITAWDPCASFAHTWVINGEITSEVRYDLEATSSGTELRLTHVQLPDEMSGGYAPGWHAYLVRLEAVLAGDPPPDWMEVFSAVAPEYR
jgi:uncharacterized protein YndB with AHSA1/START domain